MAKARRAHDAYYTPADAVATLIRRRPYIGARGQIVVEPCVGDGAIASPFRARGAVVVTNDLVPTIAADYHDDAAAAFTWVRLNAFITSTIGIPNLWSHDAPAMRKPIEWVVTNPPFMSAMSILRWSFEHARVGVAMFLRLSFLEPTDDRGPWLAQHPPDDLIVLPRISFTGDGDTDSVTCAWMIWYTDPMVIPSTQLATNARAIEIIDKKRPALAAGLLGGTHGSDRDTEAADADDANRC